MFTISKTITGVCVALVACIMGCGQGQSRMMNKPPAIVPVPKAVKMAQGSLVLGTRVVAAQAQLRPLAVIVADEIRLLTGKKMSVAQGKAGTGDILLTIDNELKGEAYSLQVGDTALVRGGNYSAVAMGTVSLLQAMSVQDGIVKVPHMDVSDEPFSSYRGFMLDLARKWHEIETVKQVVVMCRWYKIRYLQLHLTDDESCVFPSSAYPNPATKNRHYTLKQLNELETFARDRGVTIIPELETPGHSQELRKAIPQLSCAYVGITRRAICPGKESTYEILDKLIGEICDVFQTTPYFHIGCDEVNRRGWDNCSDCKAYMQKHKLDDSMELYRHFIVRMNEVVKKHGKKTIVWEGFHKEGKVDIPRDITVMIFECRYNMPADLIADGYPVINTAWQPLYVVNKRKWSPEKIYGWNMYRWESPWKHSVAYGEGIDVAPTEQVLGAQMCAWDQADDIEIQSIRKRLPAMCERIWSPDAKCGFKDFAARLSVTDASLTKLLQIKEANTGNNKQGEIGK